jgi:hypothetical protein
MRQSKKLKRQEKKITQKEIFMEFFRGFDPMSQMNFHVQLVAETSNSC